MLLNNNDSLVQYICIQFACQSLLSSRKTKLNSEGQQFLWFIKISREKANSNDRSRWKSLLGIGKNVWVGRCHKSVNLILILPYWKLELLKSSFWRQNMKKIGHKNWKGNHEMSRVWRLVKWSKRIRWYFRTNTKSVN